MKREGGFAFAAALMLMLVVAILVTAVLTMSMSAQLLATSRHEYTQAIYLAEAGVNALIAEWRYLGAENPPAQPYGGALANGESAGSYYVTWTGPNDSGVVTVDSLGTVNTGLTGTIYHLQRTVQVKLDTDGDWAWNHVYYSDSDLPGQDESPYATINGIVEVEIDGTVGAPEDFVDHANGPMGGGMLPSPMWDLWHEWVRADMTCDPVTHEQIIRDPDGDGLADPRWPDQATLPAYTVASVDAIPDGTDGSITPRHAYWLGSSSSTPLDHALHSADGHATNDVNFFMPDAYGEVNPDAYVCNTKNKRFTVTFGKSTSTAGVYTGNFFVHGDIQIKQNARIRGTLIATGNITFFGVDNIQITPEAVDPTAPCEERVYYPALVAGGDIMVRDQGVDPGDPDQARLRVSGIIWAGDTYTGSASDVEGCVVASNVVLSGNSFVRYGMDIDGCEYEPGANPPPWFREPDRNAMQPVPRSWREL